MPAANSRPPNQRTGRPTTLVTPSTRTTASPRSNPTRGLSGPTGLRSITVADITENATHYPRRIHVVCPCDALDIDFPHDVPAKHVFAEGTCERSGASLDDARTRLVMNDPATGAFAQEYRMDLRVETDRNGHETPYYVTLARCPCHARSVPVRRVRRRSDPELDRGHHGVSVDRKRRPRPVRDVRRCDRRRGLARRDRPNREIASDRTTPGVGFGRDLDECVECSQTSPTAIDRGPNRGPPRGRVYRCRTSGGDRSRFDADCRADARDRTVESGTLDIALVRGFALARRRHHRRGWRKRSPSCMVERKTGGGRSVASRTSTSPRWSGQRTSTSRSGPPSARRSRRCSWTTRTSGERTRRRFRGCTSSGLHVLTLASKGEQTEDHAGEADVHLVDHWTAPGGPPEGMEKLQDWLDRIDEYGLGPETSEVPSVDDDPGRGTRAGLWGRSASRSTSRRP